MTIRIGFGYDVHAFAAGRLLILGGVTIPSEQGLSGHSDADAVIHAIVDALLGAAASGDIGQHFPWDCPAPVGQLVGEDALLSLEPEQDRFVAHTRLRQV